MNRRTSHAFLAFVAAGAAVSLVPQRRAQACSGGPTAVIAFPRSGAVEVSPQSSIFVGYTRSIPTGLALEGNGLPVAIGTVVPLGSNPLPLGEAWLRIEAGLAPSTSYVLRANDNGIPKEVTRFTTAASFDKAAGTAPALGRLRLWRIHYPSNRVGQGECILSEFEGYMDLGYEPGSVPATPPSEVINVLTLSAKTGGKNQSFAFSGLARRRFSWEIGTIDDTDVPDGQWPTSPLVAAWKPVLAPDREYCATLTLYGRNDLSAPPIQSTSVCAPVMEVDLTGTGCAIAGRGPADLAALLMFLAAPLISRMRSVVRRWAARRRPTSSRV